MMSNESSRNAPFMLRSSSVIVTCFLSSSPFPFFPFFFPFFLFPPCQGWNAHLQELSALHATQRNDISIDYIHKKKWATSIRERGWEGGNGWTREEEEEEEEEEMYVAGGVGRSIAS